MNFKTYLDGLPQLSSRDKECCKKPVKAAEVQVAMRGCRAIILPGLNVLPFELYFYVPDH